MDQTLDVFKKALGSLSTSKEKSNMNKMNYYS